MKKAGWLLAVLLLMTTPAEAYNVFAPDPFVSARMASFEYQTLRSMAKEGKIPGYTVMDFTRGDDISRFELADVLIAALDHGQNLTSTDKKNLRKIKKNYERELDSKGWIDPESVHREPPKIEVGGDVRIRARTNHGTDGRVRIRGRYDLGNNTTVNIGGKADIS